jgi:hypothetical protein
MIRLLETAPSVSGLAYSFGFSSPALVRRTMFATAALGVAILFAAASSHAAPIVYGDLMGNTVIYQNIREAANSAGDAGPLFGAPDVSGDSIDFDPVGFSASVIGPGVDITDGNLAFAVKAKAGNAINNILFQEFGDTTLAGLGTDNTFSSVTMHGVLNITEVDFVGINTISLPISITNFGPSGGTFGLGTDGGGGPNFAAGWSGSLLVDLTTSNPTVAAALASQGVDPDLGVTRISVNFNNTLVAIGQTGTSALIAKKDTNGIIVTTNIPEPTSCLMAVFGLAMCSVAARRSR